MDCSTDEMVQNIINKEFSKDPFKIVDEVLSPRQIFSLYNRHRNVVISTIYKKTAIMFLAMTGIIANSRICSGCNGYMRKALIKKGDGLSWICRCNKKVNKVKLYNLY